MKKRFFFNFSPSLTKDFILIYRVSVAGIFVAGCLFLQYSFNQERRRIEEKLINDSAQIENSISYNVDYLKYQFYQANKQIIEESDYLNVAKIAKILSSFVSGINNQVDPIITWNAFSWIDKKNMMSADGSGGVIKKPVNVTGRDYLEITTKVPEKLVFGKPLYGALSSRWIIPVAMGVFSKEKQYFGTLVFGLDIERILDKISKIIDNQALSFAVLKDNEIAFNSNNFVEQNRDFAIAAAKNFFAEDKKELVKILDDRGILSWDKDYSAIRIIKDSPLKIVIFYNKDGAYHQLMNLLLKQVCFMILVIFACVILFQKIYYRVVKPVSELSQLALKISKQDFSFSIQKPQSGELLDLFNTLNSVRESAKREKELSHQLEVTNIKLSKANEAKAEFLAKSSHDIKNYIFGILGLSRIILESKNRLEILQNEELQMVETIADQSEELMHFVEDLLDTSQIDVGVFSLDKMQFCEVGVLVERIVLLNKSLATRHNVIVRTEIAENLPKLYCDVRRMKQILVNLITNAIKYSNDHGNVIITAKSLTAKNQIYIEVSDQGIGMTKNEVRMALSGDGKNIDKSSLSKVDSHGIGMPIVLQLVKLHHGKIEIDSTKGVGTKVKLYFNFDGAKWKSSDDKPISDSLVSQNKSILLVEDNPTNIKITVKTLHDAGYKVVSAENGQDALKILEDGNFDLVLMDGEMPVMNGYEAAIKIREGKSFVKFKNYQEIPIIALMSSSDDETVKRALDSGMNAHLEKSSSRTKLLSAIENWLK